MKKLLTTFYLGLCLCGPAWGQTLGETLRTMPEEIRQMISSDSIPQTWGGELVAADLAHFAAQAAGLEAALAAEDARDVSTLQGQFLAAARRLETSKVMLSSADQAKVERLLESSEAVNQTLSSLTLRFAGKATSSAGSLADYPLRPVDQMGYLNVQDLLIDVRAARELSGSLQYGIVQPFRLTLSGGGPNNLDGLQVRRMQLAASALERDLAHIDDIRETLPTWKKFLREYDRLGYAGTGSNVRQLERVVERLRTFYSQLENE